MKLFSTFGDSSGVGGTSEDVSSLSDIVSLARSGTPSGLNST